MALSCWKFFLSFAVFLLNIFLYFCCFLGIPVGELFEGIQIALNEWILLVLRARNCGEFDFNARWLLVLNHMVLKSVEMVTPSPRLWDLVGWDLECFDGEVSIGAIWCKMKAAFWNWLTAQTSILKVCLSNLDWNYWPFESLCLWKQGKNCGVPWKRHHQLFGETGAEVARRHSRPTRLLPRKSDTGAKAAVSNAPSGISLRLSSSAGKLKLETKGILGVRPRIWDGTIRRLIEDGQFWTPVFS